MAGWAMMMREEGWQDGRCERRVASTVRLLRAPLFQCRTLRAVTTTDKQPMEKQGSPGA